MNLKKISATTKSIQKLEESKKREFEENKKQEEKLAWLKSRNNELANTSKGYFFIF